MSFFLRRYKQILRFFPLLFYLQFPWGKRWSFDGWNFKNFRTKARWGTATWSTSWDVVASWSLATMRSCFLDFAANDGFGENSQAVKMKNLCWMWTRGFPFSWKLEEANEFPGRCGFGKRLVSEEPSGEISDFEWFKFLALSWEKGWFTKWTAGGRVSKAKSTEEYYVQYRIQLVYIMIMILQCSTLGRFAKYYS